MVLHQAGFTVSVVNPAARLREMRRGQRERSGNWRADYLETRTVGSPGGRMEKGRESGTSPAAYPTWVIRSQTSTFLSIEVLKMPGEFFLREQGEDEHS